MHLWLFLTLLQQAEGEDELKKRQLMELAIINGTYRDSSSKSSAAGKSSNSSPYFCEFNVSNSSV